MYGTVAKMRLKPNHEEHVQALNDEFAAERGRRISGYVGSYVFRPDNNPGQLILVAIFSDRETYRANADDPEQDRWYRRMREHLDADPEWTDGEVVFADAAGSG